MDPLCGKLREILEVEAACKELGIHVAYTVAWREGEIDLERVERVLENEVRRVLDELSGKYRLEDLKSNPIIRAYRDFFWRIGIDPTKTRPSSEALVRRALRGTFPRINPVVDAGNVASARTLVSIGIYDLDKARPPLRIALSSGTEVFRPIGGKEQVVPKGVPIMLDSRGVVMHVYPHRDSVETCVDSGTRRVLIMGAGVKGVPKELVRDAVKEVVRILTSIGWRYCGEEVVK